VEACLKKTFAGGVYMRRLASFLLFVCFTLIAFSSAYAVTTEELLTRIEQLEQRVAELEKLLQPSEITEQQTVTSGQIVFEGEGIQNTRPFTVTGAWIIEWQAEGDVFMITIYTKDGDYVDILGNAKRGSSYQPQGGSYYLQVNALGKWKIAIKEER